MVYVLDHLQETYLLLTTRRWSNIWPEICSRNLNKTNISNDISLAHIETVLCWCDHQHKDYTPSKNKIVEEWWIGKYLEGSLGGLRHSPGISLERLRKTYFSQGSRSSGTGWNLPHSRIKSVELRLDLGIMLANTGCFSGRWECTCIYIPVCTKEGKLEERNMKHTLLTERPEDVQEGVAECVGRGASGYTPLRAQVPRGSQKWRQNHCGWNHNKPQRGDKWRDDVHEWADFHFRLPDMHH
jgi:hypothetical protein